MSQPVTRDLTRIVEACEIVEAELRFQVERLTQQVRPERSDSDPEHLGDLRDGYDNAARYVRILGNYQRGRVERQGRSPAAEAPVSVASDTFDEHGRVIAHVD